MTAAVRGHRLVRSPETGANSGDFGCPLDLDLVKEAESFWKLWRRNGRSIVNEVYVEAVCNER